jgi:bacterioferritin
LKVQDDEEPDAGKFLHCESIKMSNQAIIDHLNEILKHEWTGVAQYAQAGFIVEGVWREVYSDKFLDDAKESFGHAQLVGDKIVALGGVPVATRNEIKQSRDLQEVLQFSLEFEAKAVEMYSQAIDMAGDNKALVVFLEDILKEEQEGVDEYTKLLRDSGGASSSASPASKTG